MSKKLPISGVAERLLQALNGERPFAWGERVGIPKATLDGLLNQESTPTALTLLRIASQTNISLNWLLTGVGSPWVGEEPLMPGVGGGQVHSHSPVLRVAERTERYQVEGRRYLLVPSSVSGEGEEFSELLSHEQIEDCLAFKSGWLIDKLRLDPTRLALVAIRGDTMEPTMKEGDLLLVDLNDCQVRDGIFVLRQGEELVARRLQLDFDGRIIVSSDNPVYGRSTVGVEQMGRLNLLGRAVWIGRRI